MHLVALTIGRVSLAAALAAAASGCSAVSKLAKSYDVAPDGQQSDDATLRADMERGDFPGAAARARVGRAGASDDRLLRLMYQGLTAYYAGDYGASAHAMDVAAAVSDDRYTKSLSRAALAVVTNDRVMPYAASRTERLFIPYYAMMAYVRQDSIAAAAVEARRLSELLAGLADDRRPEERATHAALHALAGAVFEAAGEVNDAAVSLRLARELAGDTLAARDDGARRPARARSGHRGAGDAPADVAAATGQVVVVLEDGFVGHRVEQSIAVAVDSGDVVALQGDAGAPAALALAARLVGGGCDAAARRAGPCDRQLSAGAHFLTIAWPELASPRRAMRPSLVAVAGDSLRTTASYRADVADALESDLERQRVAIAARALVRAVVKESLADVADERGGRVARWLTTSAASLVERADTRSWQLLPAGIAVVRVTAPAGERRLAVTIASATGDSVTTDIGTVRVPPGGMAFATARVWHPRVHALAPR